MPEIPALSVVITVVSDTSEAADTLQLERCLDAFRQQVDPPPMELLVTCNGRLSGVEKLRQRYPGVNFIAVDKLRTHRSGPSREHHDELRGIGIRAARAPLVALIEDVGIPDPHWAAQLVKEHVQPWAAVGGAMENGINRALNWAVYFGDFGRYQNPVPRGPSAFVSDANVCYKRAALERVADAWSESYNEARVHRALAGRSEVLALSPDVVVRQQRLNLRLGPVLTERYVWGRSFAATRLAGAPLSRRLVLAAMTPLLPFVLFVRQAKKVFQSGRNRGAFLRSAPLTMLLNTAWSRGEFLGYLTGHPC
ncbi:MAG: glycosyltransferase family A protein [Candidatus Korobacteraceae bacterium]